MADAKLNRPLLHSQGSVVDVSGSQADFVSVRADRSDHSAERDPDAFLNQIYNYYQQRGFWNSLVRPLLYLFGLAFIFFLFVFLTMVVDYHALRKMLKMASQDCPGTGQPATPSLLREDCHGNLAVSWARINGNAGLYFAFVVFALLWLVMFVQFLMRLPTLIRMEKLFRTELKLSDRRLQHLPWSTVVQAVIQLQKRKRVCSTKRDLKEWELMCIMLRHENFLLSLYKKDIIDVNIRLTCFSCISCFSCTDEEGVPFFPSSLKMIIDYVVKAQVFDSSPGNLNNLNPKVKSPNPAHQALVAKSLIIAFRMAGIAFLLCFPVLFLYQLAQFLFSHSDIVNESPSLLATRHWTPYAHTRLRRYNEVSHYLKRRLNRAYKPSTEYINTFSSQFLANVAEFFLLVVGGVIITLSAMVFVWDDDFAFADLAFGRSAGWWLGVLLVCASLLRSLLPQENVVLEPREKYAEMAKHINFKRDLSQHQPATQLDMMDMDPTSDEAQAAIAKLLKPKIMVVLEEIVGILVVPYMLIFRLPMYAHDIVMHFHSSNRYIDGLGDQFAALGLDQLLADSELLSSLSLTPLIPPTETQPPAQEAAMSTDQPDAWRNIMEESVLAFEQQYGAGPRPTATVADIY
eukprot:m.161227 g.161227  ORF g.161227 m.161227 type:complete len:630 (-) comp16520_c0_seq2:2085-3974(-)